MGLASDRVDLLDLDCIRCPDVVVQVSRMNWFTKRAFVSFFFFTKGPGPGPCNKPENFTDTRFEQQPGIL